MTRPLSPMQLTRCEVIYGYVTRLTRETRTSIEDFTEMVVQQELLLADALRCGDFLLDGSIFKRMERNGLKLRRWMNPQVSARPSIEAENSLVLALPEPYRSACENDLAAMRGRVSVPRSEAGELRADAVGDFTRGCGETLVGLAEILADHRIDGRDRHSTLLTVRGALAGVQAQVVALQLHVDDALASQGAGAVHVERCKT